MKTTATFGPGGPQSIYRYTLRRDWTDELGLFSSAHKGTALFVMLNPSTADASKDDNTVAKCLRLARRWGYGALEVRNIFALRSTDPTGLRKVVDPIGPGNDEAIRTAAAHPEVSLIVAAWGNHGRYQQRGEHVREMLRQIARPVFAFCLTNENEPAHPLYQAECGLEGLVRYL